MLSVNVAAGEGSPVPECKEAWEPSKWGAVERLPPGGGGAAGGGRKPKKKGRKGGGRKKADEL